MDISSLSTLTGITPAQSQVYTACLQLGEATITEIATAAQTKRPTTYLLLDDLITKGLVSVIKKGYRKQTYIAEHPRRLVQLLNFRLKRAEELLPQLEALYYEPKQKPSVKMLEGRDGMRQVYEEVYEALGRGSEVLTFTNVENLQRFFPEALNDVIALFRKRKRYNVKEIDVLNEGAKAYVHRVWKMKSKNHLIRFFPPGVVFQNIDTILYENKIATFSITKHIFVLLIENRDVAAAYRTLFYTAWEAAIPAEQIIKSK